MVNLSEESVNGSYEEGSGDEHPREPESMRKLFIGGLNYSTTKDSLKSHFDQYGTVIDVVVIEDPNTRCSRGFGFITYSCSSMVDDAQAARPHSLDGRVVDVKRAVPREDSRTQEAGASVEKVFISGIKDDHDDDDLRQYFSGFGNVTQVNIVCDKESGKCRGFGFVEFDDYDPVDKVVLQKEHNVKGEILYVKKAIPKMDMNRGNVPRGSGGRDGDSRQGGKGQNRVDWGQSGNGMNQGGFGMNQSGFGMNQSGFGMNQSGFGMNQSGFGMNQGAFSMSQSRNGYNSGNNRRNNGNNWNNGDGNCGFDNDSANWGGCNPSWNDNNGFSNFGNGDSGNYNDGFGGGGNEYQGDSSNSAMRNNFNGNNRMNPYGNGNSGGREYGGANQSGGNRYGGFGGKTNFNQGNVVREGRRGF